MRAKETILTNELDRLHTTKGKVVFIVDHTETRKASDRCPKEDGTWNKTYPSSLDNLDGGIGMYKHSVVRMKGSVNAVDAPNLYIHTPGHEILNLITSDREK